MQNINIFFRLALTRLKFIVLAFDIESKRYYIFKRSSILNITLLRQTWNLIETTNASELLEVGETELIQKLLSRLDAQKPLADRERICVNDYLHSKIGLIKDTAEARMVAV